MLTTTALVSTDVRFNVAQLLKEGTGAIRNFRVEAEPFGLLTEGITMVSTLAGAVKLLCTGENLFVTGSFTATLEKTCGRCLDPFTTIIAINLEEEFYPVIDINTGGTLSQDEGVDEANQIDEQHILDMQEVVRQEFILHSETSRYCRSDCEGLCPTCGQNLNDVNCDCETDRIDSRWADLLVLQNEMNSNTDE